MNIKKRSSELSGNLPELTEKELATITLNVKTAPGQTADPRWRQRIGLILFAYKTMRNASDYFTGTKIRVLPQPSGAGIAVGTTKDSVVKFWVGVGALAPRDGSYRQLILSPNQLQTAAFDWEDVVIDGLEGKNFSKIRVMKLRSED